MSNKAQLACLIVLLFAAQFGFSQKGSEVTAHNFSITFSAEFYNIVSPNATLGNMTDGWSDALSYDEAAELKESNPSRYFHYMTKKKITEMTMEAFKGQLDIQIKDLGSLAGKVDYAGSYPAERKLKNALKTADGEEFYLSYAVDMFKGGVGVGPAGVSLGGNLKPTTTITLIIADAKGKVIQEFEVKEKTDIIVGKTKTSVGNVEMGDGEDPDEVMTKTLEVYKNALDVLIADYLKDNKKAYK